MRELPLSLPAYAWRFDLLLELSRRVAFPARFIAQGGALWRFIAGEPVSIHPREDALILTRAHAIELADSQLIDSTRRALGLERDQSHFYAYAKADEALWSVVEPLHGMPLMCAETVFEALVTLIIEQHISWRGALRALQTLLRLAGDCITLDCGIVCDFPSPHQIASLTREQLKALKITDRRIALIQSIARQVCAGELDLEALRNMDGADAYAQLLQIKGVGPWTAANVIGRTFGDFRYVTANDVALQAAVNHYFHAGVGGKSARQVEDTLVVYGDYAGLAGHLTLLRWVLDRYPATSQA